MKQFIVLAICVSVLLASIPLQSLHAQTPTATAPSTAAQSVACPGTPPTQLAVGMQVQVTPFQSGDQATPVRVHAQPGTGTKVIGQLNSGDQALIVGGPQCTDGYLWWQIKLGDGTVGWVAEGTTDRYFIDPLNGPSAPSPASTTAAAGTGQPTAESTRQFAAHLNRGVTASYSPDGRYVLTYYYNDGQYPDTSDSGSVGIADLWDAKSGEHLRQIVSPTPTNPNYPDYDNVSHHYGGNAAFSPDGRYIVTAQTDAGNPNMGENANVQFLLVAWVWDTETGALHKEYRFVEPVHSTLNDAAWIAFSPDGKQILLADNFLELVTIDVAAGTIQTIQKGKYAQPNLVLAAFARDGHHLAIGSDDAPTLTLLDVTNPSQRKDVSPPNSAGLESTGLRGLAFSPDGRTILAGYGNEGAGVALLWDVGSMTPQKVQFAEPKGEELNCVAFAHDGKHIVTGSGTTVRLWDVATGALIREYKGHAVKVKSVTFSPDDKFILSGGDDGTARIWDVASGQEALPYLAPP